MHYLEFELLPKSLQIQYIESENEYLRLKNEIESECKSEINSLLTLSDEQICIKYNVDSLNEAVDLIKEDYQSALNELNRQYDY